MARHAAPARLRRGNGAYAGDLRCRMRFVERYALEAIGYIPPAEAEANHFGQLADQATITCSSKFGRANTTKKPAAPSAREAYFHSDKEKAAESKTFGVRMPNFFIRR